MCQLSYLNGYGEVMPEMSCIRVKVGGVGLYQVICEGTVDGAQSQFHCQCEQYDGAEKS